MASKKNKKAATTEPTTDGVSEGAVATAPAAGPTLQDACEAYLKHMDRAGKSGGTISSYMMELRLAKEELGAETLLAAITPEMVATYFGCKRVTKLKSGRPKAKPSIDKTRRVLRLALVHAAEKGLIERAPLPEKVEAS